MRKTLIMAKFNFKNTVQSRVFIIITLIGPFLILALTVLPGLLTEKSMTVKEGTRIGLVDVNPALKRQLDSSMRTLFIFQDFNTAEEVKVGIDAENLSGGVVAFNGGESFLYLSRTATDIVTFETLKSVINRMVIGTRLEEAGLDSAYIDELSREPAWSQQKASSGEGEEEQDFVSYLYTSLGFVMLLYMTTLLYGQMIGRSVVVEKTSKTVEVMLSSVRPSELMFGKILGLGLAGLVQYLFWIGLSLLIILVLGPALNISLPASIRPASMGYLFLFFILAFFLYSSIYAAIGAASEDEQHMGQLGWPLIIFLVIPMVLVSTLVANPEGLLTKILSFFPLTAPTVMLIRVLVQMPALWELGLFLIIMIVSIVLAVVGSGKIFRLGILLSGKKMSIREVLKLLRQA
ncbi:MAG: ABC transporter permease [Spirochaetales bacterium]|nr:ABC transporter permease [Spirochaetales bacterium]